MCRDDWDELDPYRLPPRQPDNLVLPFVRPDVSIAVTSPSVPYALPGYIETEDGFYFFLTEDGIYLVIEGVSALTTEDGIDIDVVPFVSLIVEP